MAAVRQPRPSASSRESDDLEVLSRTLLAITEQTGTREVLQMIVESARSLVGADYAALGIPDESGRFAEFYAAGVPDEQWEAIGPVPRAHGLLGAMLRDAGVHRLADLRTDPGFSGWPDEHPEMAAFLGVPITDSGEVLGSVWVSNAAEGREFDAEDERRLGILAAHAALALTRARLLERERELTLVEERSRIARELHDAVAQKLFSLRLTVSAAEAFAHKGGTERLTEELGSAKDLTAGALDELRAILSELRPPALREDGLVPALRKHLAVIGRAYAMDVRFVSDCDGRCMLDDSVEEAVFRVAQEAVHNAVRHAAPTHVEVELETPDQGVRLTVSDNGSGFEADPASRGGHHLGIMSMKERARQLGGRLRVTSPSGEGTTVRLEIPVKDTVNDAVNEPVKPIRVLVVDDHQVVRRGLRAFLDVQDDIEVVGEASDGAEAVASIEALLPDVVLLDLQLPNVDGVAALRMLREREVTTRVLVLTSFTEPSTVVPALRAGAVGYLFKDVDPSALAQGIRAVHAGQFLLEPEIAGALLAGDQADARAGSLTDREQEVLAEIAHGRSNREIARALVLSEKTVKTHVSSILAKLGLSDRTQAALYAVRSGIV